MRKVILQLAVSLDGFIEGPHGEFDWCLTDDDYGMTDFYKRIDAIFIGRKSYEVALSMGDNAFPGLPPLKEYVFSNSLKHLPGNGDIGKRRLIRGSKYYKKQSRKRYLVVWRRRIDLFIYKYGPGR